MTESIAVKGKTGEASMALLLPNATLKNDALPLSCQGLIVMKAHSYSLFHFLFPRTNQYLAI